MGVTSSAVQIVIEMVDENSGEVIGGVERKIAGLGESSRRAGSSLKTFGEGAGLEKLENQFTAGEGKIRTMNAEVRSLQGSIFGDTRAASEFLATLPGVGAAMELAFPVFGATALIGVIGMGVEKMGEFYHKVLDVNAAIGDYNKEVEKAKDEDFGNTHSIENTKLRIDEATGAVKGYLSAAAALDQKANHTIAHALDPWALYMTWQAHSMNETAMDWQRKLDTLQKQREPEQRHQDKIDEIGLEHGGDRALIGERKRTAELEKQREILIENARYEHEQDSLYGNPAAANSLWSSGELSPTSTKELTAEKEARADNAIAARAQEQDLAHLREEALEARLRGSALYHAQEAFAIADLKYKEIDRATAAEYIREKFHNEEMQRHEDEGRETQKIQMQAALVGFTGIGKIQAQGDIDIGDVRGNQQLPDEEKDKRVAAIKLRTNLEMLQSEREFTAQVDALADERTQHGLKGFAAIDAAARRAIDEKQRAFDKEYGQIDRNAPGGEQAYQSGLSNLNREKGLIGQGAQQDSADLARRNADETSELESQARAKMLSSEQQQTAALGTEYEERLRKFKEERDAEVASGLLTRQQLFSVEQDYNRRVVAAGELRDAEMAEAAKRAREKMAGEFTSFFKSLDHPTEALKDLGDKVAGEAAASIVQRMQGHFGGAGAPSPAGASGSVIDKVFARIAGSGRGAAGAGHGAPHGGVPEVASVKAISLGTAEIHIQSANLSFGSAGAYSSGSSTGSAGAPFGGSGSTPLSVAGGGFSTGGGGTSSGGGFGGGFGGYGSTAGGAGDQGFNGSGPVGFNGSAGVAPQHKSVIGSAIGAVKQGAGLFKEAKGIFGSKSSTGDYADVHNPALTGKLNADGTYTSSGSTNNGMLGGGGIGANIAGAAGGALGMYSAIEGNGGWGGAASGAMSGMKLGMALGGPIGAGIGAAAGAVVGAIGFGGRENGRVYDLKTVRPRLANDFDAYAQGSMDYLSAYSDMQSLDQEARSTLDKMGGSARDYYWDTINKEIHTAEGKISGEQRAGRSQYTAQAAQYDIGTDSVPRDGLAYIHQRERIMPSDQNERITRAIEGGADSSRMPADSAGWNGDVHIHAFDTKSVEKLLFDKKHTLRAAVNASYAENSGGADA